jgi:acyl-CoA-binding protein
MCLAVIFSSSYNGQVVKAANSGSVTLSEITEIASDIQIESLTFVGGSVDYAFTFKFTSGKKRSYCVFNPPDGDKFKILGINKVVVGANTINFKISKSKLTDVDMVTINLFNDDASSNYLGFQTSELTGGSSVSEEPVVSKIVATEESVSMKPNQTVKLKVFAIYSNGKEVDITSNKLTTYRSSSNSVASITAGVVKAGSSSGTAQITITYNEAKLDLPVNVSALEVKALTVSNPSLRLGSGQATTVKVYATLKDNTRKEVTSDATWIATDASVADVDDGQIMGMATGETKVVVNYLGMEKEIAVEVSDEPVKTIDSLEASEKSVKMRVGQQQELYVYAVYDDGTREDVSGEVLWSSSKNSVVSINDAILVAKAIGTATIKATIDDQVVQVRVAVEKSKKLKALAASTKSFSILEGGTYTVKVTATYVDNSKEDVTSKVSWTVANPDVVDVKSGKFYAGEIGKTLVSGKFDGKLIQLTVTVK